MPQTLAARSSITNLKQVEESFNLVAKDEFFQEWYAGLPELSAHERNEVDHLQHRFLLHRDGGQLTEGSVDAYMLACPSRDRPVFGMAANGNAFAFVKLDFVKLDSISPEPIQYAISDTFITRSRTNQLTTVLQILKQIKQLIEP